MGNDCRSMRIYQIDKHNNDIILLNNGKMDIVKFDINKIDNQNLLTLKIEKDISNILYL